MAQGMTHTHSSVVTIRTVSGLDILAGLWLIAAPFLMNFADISNAMANDVIIGVLVAVLAGSRIFGEGYKIAWPSWVNVVLGVWLLFAPYALGYATAATPFWNDIILGIAVIVLATWSALSTPDSGEEMSNNV